MSTVLRNCRIVGRGDRLRDILVHDGRVLPVTDAAAHGAAESVDLDGRFVGAGLWDHHVHMSQWALTRRRVDLSGAASAAQAVELVRERIAAQPPAEGEIVVGYGFRDALWADAPTRAALDDAAGTHPVVLVSGDIHAAWVNTAALARLGFSGAEFSGARFSGARLGDAALGDAGLGIGGSGLLREADAFRVNIAVSEVEERLLDTWVAEAAAEAAARGVVGIVELEMADNLRSWTRRIAAGTRLLRVRAGVYLDRLDQVIAAGLRTGDAIDGTDGLLRLGPFKIITDGSLNTRTALCHDPYPGMSTDPDGRGISAYGFDELVAHMSRAAANGIEPAVHAIGDRANQLALDAFEEASCTGSIEHAQLLSVMDFARFAELGVTASVQPEHAMDDRDVADRLWAGRTDRAFAWDSLLEADARLRLGSDAPVAPLDPWISMAAAVSRARDGREPWHPEQRIVASAAYAASVERPLVSIGDPADLAITDSDPLTATDAALRSMSVAGTMLGGEWTHRTL